MDRYTDRVGQDHLQTGLTATGPFRRAVAMPTVAKLPEAPDWDTSTFRGYWALGVNSINSAGRSGGGPTSMANRSR